MSGGLNEDGTPAEATTVLTPGSNVFNEPGNVKQKRLEQN